MYACSEGKCDGLNYSDGKPVGYSLGICVVFNKCNLLTDVGCAGTQSCVNTKDGKTCIGAGTQTEGQSCAAAGCVKGTTCVGNPPVCLAKCNTAGGAPTCTGAKKCATVTSGAGGAPLPDNLGVCAP